MSKIKIFLRLAAIAAILFAAGACRKYAVAPENNEFSISASITDEGGDVWLLVSLAGGPADGKNTLSLSVADEAGKSQSSLRLLANGRTAIDAGDEWTFNKNGEARFVIEGLPSGTYRATVLVKRWYHTASDTVEFTVN